MGAQVVLVLAVVAVSLLAIASGNVPLTKVDGIGSFGATNERSKFVEFIRRTLVEGFSRLKLEKAFHELQQEHFDKVVNPRYEKIRKTDPAEMKDPFDRFQFVDVLDWDKVKEEYEKSGSIIENRLTLNREYAVELSSKSGKDLEDEDGSAPEYFDASHIGERFICSQAPLHTDVDTQRLFWKMVFEKKVDAIVNVLTFETVIYYPTISNIVENYGDYVVKRLDAHRYEYRTHWIEDYSLEEDPARTMIIELEVSYNGKKRFVTLYRIFGWVDNGVTINSLAPISVLQQIVQKNKILVHCSAGIGRSGSFIVMSIAFANILNGVEFDLLDLIRSVRAYRNHLVCTGDQFVFIHYILLKYAHLMGYFHDDSLLTNLYTFRAFEFSFLSVTAYRSYRMHKGHHDRVPADEPHFSDFLEWVETKKDTKATLRKALDLDLRAIDNKESPPDNSNPKKSSNRGQQTSQRRAKRTPTRGTNSGAAQISKSGNDVRVRRTASRQRRNTKNLTSSRRTSNRRQAHESETAAANSDGETLAAWAVKGVKKFFNGKN